MKRTTLGSRAGAPRVEGPGAAATPEPGACCKVEACSGTTGPITRALVPRGRDPGKNVPGQSGRGGRGSVGLMTQGTPKP